MIKRYGDYFDRKTIVITGAASGMGRETALLFGGQGANVVCADVDEEQGRRTAARIAEAGGVADFVKTDVTRRADVRRLAEQAAQMRAEGSGYLGYRLGIGASGQWMYLVGGD